MVGAGKRKLKGQGEVRIKGQGEVRMRGQGKVRRVEACPGMSGHVPAEGAADKPRRRAGNQADQSGADTKPSPSNQEPTRSPWTPITAEPAFSSLYGSPGQGYKTLPHPRRLRRLPLPCRLPLLRRPPSLPCSPAPGSSAREGQPNKRP